MEEIREFLPFLIPLVIVQFTLLAVALRHILTHKTYKRGNRALWLDHSGVHELCRPDPLFPAGQGGGMRC